MRRYQVARHRDDITWGRLLVMLPFGFLLCIAGVLLVFLLGWGILEAFGHLGV